MVQFSIDTVRRNWKPLTLNWGLKVLLSIKVIKIMEFGLGDFFFLFNTKFSEEKLQEM